MASRGNHGYSNATRKIAAVVMVGVLAGIVTVASAQFLGWFASTAHVTLYADRAGLVMNPDARVRLRGVEVGRVKSVSTDGDRARIDLNMQTSQLKYIPANVRADISSNTIFGAKAVNLEIPESGGQGTLGAGSVITADHVVVELNTVYQQLVDVLAQLQPDKLNVTIGAVDEALSGRGKQIGDSLVQLTDILGKTNPHLPELNRLLREASGATNVYADAMPNLMRIVDNATVLGNTFVDNSANLDALLINVTGMGNTINGVLSRSKKDLMSTLTDLNPVSRLLGRQAPGLRCFITAASDAADIATPLLGGRNGMLLLDAGLIPGQDPYKYPNDLPEVRGDGPPTCQAGLTDIQSKEHVPFYVVDNAPQPYQPRTTPKVESRKLFQLLFGGTPRG
ncbi:MCE family protein [Gordonia hydrophobica]|uniref:MCE family protein n=1 Tax=Gordonia hydrophobica TaxID=40516 RepID=A0ABZ2TYX2_9ACTN|nr:MCE family protein [Gordonia hydrophobica]MBM7366033.1 phospholipid/cholesterol/gamma-HCH transport system substrate-binding protein [Gordonia hydrophobica]